jgi:drug/metabolite transporter (DMT)-like permease
MTNALRIDRHSWGLIAILSVLWGAAFFLIEVGLRSYPPMTLVFARLIIAAPILWIALHMTGGALPRDVRSWTMLTVVGALNCALPFALFFWGQQYLDSGYAAILNATTPLWGVIVAHMMTSDEKLTPARIIGVMVGLVGIIVMVGRDALGGLTDNLLAQLACLISTLFYSFAAIYGRRLSQAAMPPLVIATGQTMAAALLMLPIMLLVDQPWTLTSPQLDATLAALILAVFSTALAYVLYFRLINRAGASNAQLVAFIMPVLAVILGVAFLNEILVARQIGGAALIALGLVILDGRIVTRLAPRRAVP